jgi:SAM-dependent methyltransferase
MDFPHSPAADRNKGPILEVLRQVLPARGTALEIASGTGQHAAWFAAALPDWTWQATEADAEMLPALASRIALEGLANLRAPVLLDATAPQWPLTETFDAVYCANMIHIAPWPACVGLMQGAARHLRPGGLLVTYGPYFEDDVEPAPSNLAFDESLKARDAAWGIRSLEEVVAQAQRCGLWLWQRHDMPANNLLLVFRS